MFYNISDFSFSNENKVFYANGDGFNNFPIAHVGKKSYISSAIIEAGIVKDSTSLVIGNFCSIAHNVNFLINLDHNYLDISTYPLRLINSKWENIEDIKRGQIIIGNDVWIGRGATILDGVIIGNGAVVAANSTVTKNIPPYAIVAGNPAKIKKYRFSDEIISKLDIIKWWYWDYDRILSNEQFFTSYSENIIEELYNESVNKNQLETNHNDDDFRFIKVKFLFNADFNSPYPIWRKVIDEFIDYYSVMDDAILIIYVDDLALYEAEINYITNILSKNSNAPLIDIETKSDFCDELELLKKVDYFITNRDITTIKMVDYAYDYNIKVISGMKNNIFGFEN